MASAISRGISRSAGRRPVHVVQRGVLAQRALAAAVIEEIPSSGQVGYSGEHSEPRHREGAAGVGPVGAGVASCSPRSQPRRKPDMKASPAPSTLNTSTGKALADDSAFEIVGDRPV